MTELVKPLRDYAGSQKFAMVVGEKLSYLKAEEQQWLADVIADNGIFPRRRRRSS